MAPGSADKAREERRRGPRGWFVTDKGEIPWFLTILLVVFLVLALGGGGWGRSRYGAWSWSPAAVILLIASY